LEQWSGVQARAEWFQKKRMIPEKAHDSRKSTRFQKKLIPPQRGVPLPRGTILDQ
jgi:hypothetical protein